MFILRKIKIILLFALLKVVDVLIFILFASNIIVLFFLGWLDIILRWKALVQIEWVHLWWFYIVHHHDSKWFFVKMLWAVCYLNLASIINGLGKLFLLLNELVFISFIIHYRFIHNFLVLIIVIPRIFIDWQIINWSWLHLFFIRNQIFFNMNRRLTAVNIWINISLILNFGGLMF